MINKNNDFINSISNRKLSDGHYIITIIFHNNIWKDVLITKFSEKPEIETEIIEKTGFFDLLNNINSYPEYGQLEFEIWINNKRITDYLMKTTHRIHNKKETNVK